MRTDYLKTLVSETRWLASALHLAGQHDTVASQVAQRGVTRRRLDARARLCSGCAPRARPVCARAFSLPPLPGI